MENTELLMKAISFASRAHQGQLRKDDKTPYISHPFRVCMTLRNVFGIEDERALAAAVLHDTIEDTKTDFDDLNENFGREVASWVGLLSKDKRMIEEEREAAYAERLKKAPDEVKLIKLADIYDNVLDATTALSKSHEEKTLKRSQYYLDAMKAEPSAPVLKSIAIVEVLIRKASQEWATNNKKEEAPKNEQPNTPI